MEQLLAMHIHVKYWLSVIGTQDMCHYSQLSVVAGCNTVQCLTMAAYCEKVYERTGKNFFWSIKHFGEIINKLKLRGFLAASLCTYDFSTLYTTLPHNFLTERLKDLTEWSFQREDSL